MSKFEKLLQKIKQLDKDLRFDELKKVLLSYGYALRFPHSGSSHATFRKKAMIPSPSPPMNQSSASTSC